MKLQIALATASTKWVMPSKEDLILEYKYEYALPQRNWDARCKVIGAPYPLFKDQEDFVSWVLGSPIVTLPKNARVHNMTELNTIGEIEDLVSGYAFPRDVKRIITGLKSGVLMPAPIIIKGTKGMWILSGNTRQNVAKVLNIPRKFILVNAT